MNANNNGKKGKGGKGGKQNNIDTFYSPKPADETPASTNSQLEGANNDNTTKWKRVAKPDADAVATSATPQEPQTPPPTKEATVAPPAPKKASEVATVATEAQSDAPTEAQSDAPTEAQADVPTEAPVVVASARDDGPPPVCRLNDDAPKQANTEQLQVSEAQLRNVIENQQELRDVITNQNSIIANQQKMLEMMMKQQAVPIPFGYPVPMSGWMGPMVQIGTAPVATPIPAPVVVSAPPVEQKAPETTKPAVKQTSKSPKHHKHPKEDEDDTDAEFAPFDLKLNTDCPAGFKCPHSRKPTDCPKNHNFLGPVIKKGTKLSKFFCKWERPWKKGPNGKPMRCRSIVCYNSHLEGREEFLRKLDAKADASPEAQ